jgi:hypothetical protein
MARTPISVGSRRWKIVWRRFPPITTRGLLRDSGDLANNVVEAPGWEYFLALGWSKWFWSWFTLGIYTNYTRGE